jgi:hypothetical protein
MLPTFAWASFKVDRVLTHSYSIDCIADLALEIATLGAVVALFVSALV